MNICFFSGRIISDIEFKFIINSKHFSISYFNLQLNNGSIIKIIGYNEIADYCYQNLKINNYIFLEGFLKSNYEIIINNIKISYLNEKMYEQGFIDGVNLLLECLYK